MIICEKCQKEIRSGEAFRLLGKGKAEHKRCDDADKRPTTTD